ncbi:hypothetical protein BDW68DRAFT_178429 [Aspergillus falconensis]
MEQNIHHGKTFSEHLQQFSVLAQEAGGDPDDYKDDLYESMTRRMKFAVLNYYNDASMGFDAFVENCHRTADALASIDMTKKHDKSQSSTALAARSQSNGKASRPASTTKAITVTTTQAEKAPTGGWAPITVKNANAAAWKDSASTAARRAILLLTAQRRPPHLP